MHSMHSMHNVNTLAGKLPYCSAICKRENAMLLKRLKVFISSNLKCWPLQDLWLFSHKWCILKGPQLLFYFVKALVFNDFFLNMPGRAGRVSKGYCYRLVTKQFWEREISDHMIPDMLVSVFFPLFIQPKHQSHHLDIFHFTTNKIKQLAPYLLLSVSVLHWPPSYWKWSPWTWGILGPSSQWLSRPQTSVTLWEQCCSWRRYSLKNPALKF